MPHRSVKLTALLAAVSLAAAALAGCTATPQPAAGQTETEAAQTAQAADTGHDAAVPTPSPTPETPCEAAANASGIADTGPRAHASGEVTLDSNGYPVTYTVAPNDAAGAVVERLCINLTILASLNQGLCPWVTSNPQPGDVWNLDSLDPVALHEFDEKDC
ncbi:hypothetical protein [Microbacterium sp. KR10-403]|uniref:hypothetical protein n=1 Tax=Microbacterium sp. KR10-403 TaxID=3158581 RepID=UPI0032E3B408